MLTLTNEQISFQNYFKSSKRIISIHDIPHKDVYKYLSASDIGFLIRSNHILNQVSSPIKFAEYLVCGNPVIITPWVGDQSDLVNIYDLGVVIEGEKETDISRIEEFIIKYKKDVTGYRKWCSRFAQDYLSWDALVDRLTEVYN